mgnify:CR=1 FL=1
MITRRNFLKAGAAVAALSVVPNGFASILAKKEKAIGVQLYSVRDDLKTDFDGTMKALVDIGYKRKPPVTGMANSTGNPRPR